MLAPQEDVLHSVNVKEEEVRMSQSADRDLGFLPALERALSARGQWQISNTEAVLLNMFFAMMNAYAARLGHATDLSEEENLRKACEYGEELARLKFDN